MQLLVRIVGELATKSRPVRRRFKQRLRHNLAAGLRSAGISGSIEDHHSYLLVETDDADAVQILSRVFGVHAIGVIERTVKADLEAIVESGEAVFRDLVRDKTFAVRARRTGDHAFRSQDVQERLGAALLPYARGVDLTNPEFTARVTVRDDLAYLHHAEAAGPGGLPLGTEAYAVALISGGFDSAVSAWRILKRGVALDYVFCNLAGAAYERTVVGVVKVLADHWSYGTSPRLHVLDFAPVVEDLKRAVTPRFVQVVLKRLMYRAADRIAREVGGDAIVTGESIGQVSSQTLKNLRAIDDASSLPVLRPLVGLDKEEIIEETRRIGTYPLSLHLQEYCALVPDKPSTAARPDRVRSEEARLDPALLDAALAGRRVLTVSDLDALDLVLPYLYKDEIPEGAGVVDCRTPAQFESWHHPGASNLRPGEILAARLDRKRPYILYCAFGLESAVIAERMQEKGYEAYSFKGGVRALRRLADRGPAR